MLHYLYPNSDQTLREALQELRAAEGVDHDATQQVAAELRNDLDLHDAIHALFGCPTSVAGEVLAHVWTLVGTTARLSDLHRVVSHRDHRQALAEIGHAHLLKMWAITLPRIAFTLWRAVRMTKRIRVEDLPLMLDRSLAEIRAEYGIKISGPIDGPRRGALVRKIHRSSRLANPPLVESR